MSFELEAWFREDGPIASRLAGFEPRPQQVHMAKAVAAAFAEKRTAIVEAPTGVGKSFAYLIPAIGQVTQHRERVLVVTNTINLQEQLLEKDLPLLNAVIPDEFTSVLVKGRGNYLSLRRLERASQRKTKLFPDEATRHALHVIEDWAYETTDGTLSTLPELDRFGVWDHVESDANNCMGRKCKNYDVCFFQQARRRMEQGNLLVCNHALFFSDLALRARGVGFLPPYQHVILDEAHCIEDVASEHFGLSLSEARVQHLLRLLYHPRRQGGILPTLRMRSGGQERLDQAIALVQRIGDASELFFNGIDLWLREKAPPNGRIATPGLFEDHLSSRMGELATRLRLLKDDVELEQDAYELNSLAERAEAIATSVTTLLEQDIEGCVYWAEASARRGRSRRGERSNRISIKCMAVDVAPILRDQLFNDTKGVVLTSATLTTGPGVFEHFKQRLGCDHATELELDSPFDYGLQMRTIVDTTMPEPSHRDYLRELCLRLMEQIEATDGGAFILFTSLSALQQAADHLRPALEDLGYRVLVQGRGTPPTALIERFRESERAVLFGTGRFWQGVDVRGHALRNVIVTRLPFAVPTQPLVEARHELIKSRGGNPFMEDQVPHALIRFKQGIGRLIRSTEDEGRVVVLDSRVVSKPYGRAFLAAFPDDVNIEYITERESSEAFEFD